MFAWKRTDSIIYNTKSNRDVARSSVSNNSKIEYSTRYGDRNGKQERLFVFSCLDYTVIRSVIFIFFEYPWVINIHFRFIETLFLGQKLLVSFIIGGPRVR